MTVQEPPTISDVLALAWQRYTQQLKQRPLLTKAVTSGCIAALSDIAAQSLSKDKRRWSRTLAVTMYGLLWNGPSAHFWQMLMERIFKHAAGLQTVFKKVVVDQLVYGPTCTMLFMSFATLFLEGRKLAAVPVKLESDYPHVQMQAWKLWPAVSLVNYMFVPVQLRVLVINISAFFWSLYLITRSRGSSALVK